MSAGEPAWLLAMEEEQNRRFLECFERLQSRRDLHAVLLDLLQQRRLLSLELFTPMMDRLICALENDDARAIANGILQEEYGPLNHRYLFFQEILRLGGVQRRDIICARPSAGTLEVMDRIKEEVWRVQSATEIERLVFLRYFAEVLPGHEFSQISNLLHNSGILRREKQRFIYPHVEFDMIGKHGASHAAQYLPIIAKVAEARDEATIRPLIEASAELRILFYSQFED